MFNPGRLTLARQRRGLTKKAVAEAAGLSVKSVSDYENGHAVPTESTVVSLARVVRFPPSFFLAPDLEVPRSDGASFRAMSAMTASQRDSALGAGALAILLSEWIEEKFSLPQPSVPELRGLSPEAAAETVRSAWKLGQLAVRNIVHLLELHGVRVFSLVEKCREVDAFSLWWKGKTPFVFLNTQKTAEHSRFDAAHELGHLVLHRHGDPGGREAEHEADAFASAFLMPRASVISAMRAFPKLDAIIKLKRNWNVSVAALTRRLYDLKMLTEWHYRNLFIQISERGYRKSEPNSIPPEKSQILEKVLQALRKDGTSLSEIAKELHLFPEDVGEVVFGLATVSVPSTLLSGSQSGRPARPTLRLV